MPKQPAYGARYTAVARPHVWAWLSGRCPPNDSAAKAAECSTERDGEAVGLSPTAFAPVFLAETPIFTVSVETLSIRHKIATNSLSLFAV